RAEISKDLPHLFGVEFSAEVGHHRTILLEHVSHPTPQLSIGMRFHVLLVEHWRFYPRSRIPLSVTKQFFLRNFRRNACSAVADLAKAVVQLIAWRKKTNKGDDRTTLFGANHISRAGHRPAPLGDEQKQVFV